jgi:UTP--glucose-1-phosphate uridylyltransferase
MLPIVDKPTIQYVVEEAIASGIEDILIITGKGKRAIEDHFDHSPELEQLLEKGHKTELLDMVRSISGMASIHYIRQKEALGLGNAVWMARQHVGSEPFAVLLGDDIVVSERPALGQLIDEFDRRGTSVVAVQHVRDEEVGRYGIVGLVSSEGRAHKVRDLVEKPKLAEAPSRLGIIGRYVLEPRIFGLLETLPPGVNGEIQLTDALRLLNVEKSICAYELAGTRYDVGDKVGYLQANVEFALARPDLGPEVERYLLALADTLQGRAEAAAANQKK